MNSLADRRQYVPSKDLLYSLLAVVATLIIALGDSVLVRSFILAQV